MAADFVHIEIQGLLWENYRDAELFVARSIWSGKASDPKTRKGRAPVPVIRQLADRLEMHRLRSGSPEKGLIFANGRGNPLVLRHGLSWRPLSQSAKDEGKNNLDLVFPQST